MAERPTFASVTDSPCKCGYLEQAADSPDQPIVFDKRTGEYHFRYRAGDDKVPHELVIYHCPFCGGAAPKSKRPLLFHSISSDEEQRLCDVLDGVTSIQAAIERLGKPDGDDPRGTCSKTPAQQGHSPTTQWFRTLRYEHLSDVADVWITENADGRASWWLQGKAK